MEIWKAYCCIYNIVSMTARRQTPLHVHLRQVAPCERPEAQPHQSHTQSSSPAAKHPTNATRCYEIFLALFIARLAVITTMKSCNANREFIHSSESPPTHPSEHYLKQSSRERHKLCHACAPHFPGSHTGINRERLKGPYPGTTGGLFPLSHLARLRISQRPDQLDTRLALYVVSTISVTLALAQEREQHLQTRNGPSRRRDSKCTIRQLFFHFFILRC